MKDSDKIVFRGCKVCNPGSLPCEAEVTVAEGMISSVVLGTAPKEAIEVAASGKILMPGFIDLHVHGAGGRDASEGSFEAIETISLALAAEGTTSFLATILSSFQEGSRNFMLPEALQFRFSGAQAMGIHLEGPYLNPEFAGMIPLKSLATVSELFPEEILEACRGELKMMTLAPELPGSHRVIEMLLKEGVVPSIGHTGATFDQTNRAIACGVRHATHLFNAMKGFHHRDPGAAGALLMEDSVVCQIIADGMHLHPSVVHFIARIKGVESIALITDGLPSLGEKRKSGFYLGRPYEIRNGAIFSLDGTLAGTVLGQLALLKRFSAFTEIPIHSLLACSTTVPAKVLGIAERKGRIAPGMDADMLLLDEEWNLEQTWVKGKCVYCRDMRIDKE
ncbi:MAG: N-acetylglucosamine-6-phosphate deacetylase [Candidatus Ratteibacteria bacterium]